MKRFILLFSVVGLQAQQTSDEKITVEPNNFLVLENKVFSENTTFCVGAQSILRLINCSGNGPIKSMKLLKNSTLRLKNTPLTVRDCSDIERHPNSIIINEDKNSSIKLANPKSNL